MVSDDITILQNTKTYLKLYYVLIFRKAEINLWLDMFRICAFSFTRRPLIFLYDKRYYLNRFGNMVYGQLTYFRQSNNTARLKSVQNTHFLIKRRRIVRQKKNTV